MEVGDLRIDAFEFIWRIDEDGSIAGTFTEFAIGRDDRLQRPGRSGADGDDPSSFFLGKIETLCRIGRHRVVFRMHDVVFDLIFLDGFESAESDMKRHIQDLDPLGLDLFQQFISNKIVHL